MHASSIIALALGATAVSATVLPRQADACNGQFCQFPKTIDCPVANGKGVTRAILEETVKNSKRVGAPYELSASNLATKHCMSPDFRDIPLWATDIPSPVAGEYLGSMLYALDSKGTFYFCSTSSGMHSSGWADTCAENY